MTGPLDRRAVLWALSAAFLSSPIEGESARAAEAGLRLGPPSAFSFERLKALARQRAAAPYVAPPRPAPEAVSRIDYEALGRITFDTDHALFADSRFPVTFFHMGQFFPTAVQMFAVEAGRAREVLYDQSYFHMPPDSPARALPKGAGFAGFRVQEPRGGALDWRKNDWAAFLGASYFRAIGALRQYGLSARAVAIDTAVYDRVEDFPDFTRVFIQRPAPGADGVTVYALLEGASITGACRFVMTRGEGVTMDIDQMLIPRRPITRFGLAPLTSMFWFSETVKPAAVDWRPEVHDSDGLALWTGRGEHIWRPLGNPPGVAASAFADENPKGFGLLQRDRVFDHYQDGVLYDRRPSLWVEPKAGWGKGTVQLIELPTDDEIHDNIIAAWVPDRPAAPGEAIELGYRLYWQADEPHPSELARCVATRLGKGGQPGQPRPLGVRKFVVEFLGGPLASLSYGVKPDMALHASRGHFTDYRIMEAVPDGVAGHWRAEFDLADTVGADPVELRLVLMVGDKPVSETWMFQYHPF